EILPHIREGSLERIVVRSRGSVIGGRSVDDVPKSRRDGCFVRAARLAREGNGAGERLDFARERQIGPVRIDVCVRTRIPLEIPGARAQEGCQPFAPREPNSLVVVPYILRSAGAV